MLKGNSKNASSDEEDGRVDLFRTGPKLSKTSQAWTPELKGLFLDNYIAVKNSAGGRGVDGSGLRAPAWAKLLIAMNEVNKTHFEKSQLASLISSLKTQYTAFVSVKRKSGFGWDDEAKLPTAPESVWDDLISAQKAENRAMYKKFKSEAPIFMEKLEKIFGLVI
jgi:hypothetical protein